MEPATSALTVLYAATALKELDKIWKHNAKSYASSEHANTYVDFLKSSIKTLETDQDQGRHVQNFPKLRALTMKLSPQGAGHIAIFRLDREKQIIRNCMSTTRLKTFRDV